MNKIMAVLILFGLGLLSLIVGVSILVRKQYLLYGKKAISDGIWNVLAGLLFLGLSIALYFWGG
jgi:hypothetical protein